VVDLVVGAGPGQVVGELCAFDAAVVVKVVLLGEEARRGLGLAVAAAEEAGLAVEEELFGEAGFRGVFDEGAPISLR